MPIKPENRDRYPDDWKERRAAVLERANHCCELCAAPNHATIRRSKYTTAKWTRVQSDANMLEFSGNQQIQPEFWDSKPIIVVLTIAHLDPTYESHDIKHLLALCQRCHLKIDAHLRFKSRCVAP